jgi:putative holliday junction resolvase
MRLLGIDYGSKKIGLAISDITGRFAMPFAVIPTDKKAIGEIVQICQAEKIDLLVLGQSLDYANKPNPLMEKLEKFKQQLIEVTKLSVEYENEVLTTKEAERIIGKDKQTDARAAALILKSYIDRHAE